MDETQVGSRLNKECLNELQVSSETPRYGQTLHMLLCSQEKAGIKTIRFDCQITLPMPSLLDDEVESVRERFSHATWSRFKALWRQSVWVCYINLIVLRLDIFNMLSVLSSFTDA